MSPASDALLFGTAGVPLGSEDTSTVRGIEHTFALGLDCQEIEFVNGVKMGLDTARKVAAGAAARKIRLSAHAPYFINLNSEDRGKRLQSQERILATARIAHACEGRVNSYEEFARVLSKVEKKLGRAALKNAHIHISESHCNEAGELKHLDLMQPDFHFDDCIEALADFDVRGLVICESPNREEDALMLKKLYRAQKAKTDDPGSPPARE